MSGLEAKSSATGTSETGRLRRRSDECQTGGEEAPPSRLYNPTFTPMPEDFKDRRQHPRIYRNFILSYWLTDNAKEKFEVSQLNNISQGGVSFIATAPIVENSKVSIELSTPFLTDKILLEGSVLQSIVKIEGLIYEIRVQFEQPSQSALEILKKIETYAQQQL